jgi:hypothetical protein
MTWPSGFDIIKLGKVVSESESDPEHTMQLALTQRELGLVLFGLHFPYCLFPELQDDLRDLCKKIQEVGVAQEFIDFNKEEDD